MYSLYSVTPMVKSYETVGQHHNQDIDILQSHYTEHFHQHNMRFLMLPCLLSSFLTFSLILSATNLFSISSILSCQDNYINGSRKYVTFWDFNSVKLFVDLSSLLHISIKSLPFFISQWYSTVWMQHNMYNNSHSKGSFFFFNKF